MLSGEHPRFTGLSQRGRPGQRTGLARQDLQVVIQHHGGRALNRGAFVASYHLASVKHHQLISAQQRAEPVSDEPRRHGIGRLTRGNPGVAVHQRPQAQPSLELLDRQRPQQRRLQREILPDGASPAGDPPGVVELKVDRDLAFHGPSARITWLVAMRPGEVGGTQPSPTLATRDEGENTG
jgi:hypothetical protein